jgi:hypothetical protein
MEDMNMGNDTDMGNMTMNMVMNMEMQMTFYNDHHYKLFFDSWDFDTEEKYAGGIVALLCVSFAIELVYFLSKLTAKWARRSDTSPVMKGLLWLITAGMVYAIVMFSYLMMLAVMTYSTGVFFAVVSGLAMGRFVFQYVLVQTTLDGRVKDAEAPLVCH